MSIHDLLRAALRLPRMRFCSIYSFSHSRLISNWGTKGSDREGTRLRGVQGENGMWWRVVCVFKCDVIQRTRVCAPTQGALWGGEGPGGG